MIGGLDAFMVPIRERQQFVEAVRTKLVREISESRPRALMQPAQKRATRQLLCRGDCIGSMDAELSRIGPIASVGPALISTHSAKGSSKSISPRSSGR